MSSFNERKAKVLTHPSQLAHRELPQSVASEGEGEDPGVLEGGRQVCHGNVRTLHGPQVVTCRTTRLHGCWRLAIRATEPSTSESCQEVWRQEDGKKGERGGGTLHFYPHSHERQMCTQISCDPRNVQCGVSPFNSYLCHCSCTAGLKLKIAFDKRVGFGSL